MRTDQARDLKLDQKSAKTSRSAKRSKEPVQSLVLLTSKFRRKVQDKVARFFEK